MHGWIQWCTQTLVGFNSMVFGNFLNKNQSEQSYTKADLGCTIHTWWCIILCCSINKHVICSKFQSDSPKGNGFFHTPTLVYRKLLFMLTSQGSWITKVLWNGFPYQILGATLFLLFVWSRAMTNFIEIKISALPPVLFPYDLAFTV